MSNSAPHWRPKSSPNLHELLNPRVTQPYETCFEYQKTRNSISMDFLHYFPLFMWTVNISYFCLALTHLIVHLSDAEGLQKITKVRGYWGWCIPNTVLLMPHTKMLSGAITLFPLHPWQGNDNVMPKSCLACLWMAFTIVNAVFKKSCLSHAYMLFCMERLLRNTLPQGRTCFPKTRTTLSDACTSYWCLLIPIKHQFVIVPNPTLTTLHITPSLLVPGCPHIECGCMTRSCHRGAL